VRNRAVIYKVSEVSSSRASRMSASLCISFSHSSFNLATIMDPVIYALDLTRARNSGVREGSIPGESSICEGSKRLKTTSSNPIEGRLAPGFVLKS